MMVIYFATLITVGMAGLGAVLVAHRRRAREYRQRLHQYDREAIRSRHLGQDEEERIRNLREQCLHFSSVCAAQQQYIVRLKRQRDRALDAVCEERKRTQRVLDAADTVAFWREQQRRVWPALPDARESARDN